MRVAHGLAGKSSLISFPLKCQGARPVDEHRKAFDTGAYHCYAVPYISHSGDFACAPEGIQHLLKSKGISRT